MEQEIDITLRFNLATGKANLMTFGGGDFLGRAPLLYQGEFEGSLKVVADLKVFRHKAYILEEAFRYSGKS